MDTQLKKEATAVDKADPYVVSIARGVEYLKKEAGNGTINGDATRALLVAASKGYDIGSSLDETLAFLKQPSKWEPGTRIELASALAIAERHGKAASTDIEAAGKLLAADQKPDGSWDGDQGAIIATWLARSALISSGMQPDNFTIVQADRWIRGLAPDNVLDAAATILALELASDVMAENLRRTCLGILRQGQHADTGGWGPGDTAAPRALETAMAVLALNSLVVEPRLARSAYTASELTEAVANGKKNLVAKQRPDGSWAELSTTGWAMLALLSN